MPKAKNQSRRVYSFLWGFPPPFFASFFEKRRVGDFRYFASFSKRRFLIEGVVSFINKLHLSLYIHKWVSEYGKKNSIIKC